LLIALAICVLLFWGFWRYLQPSPPSSRPEESFANRILSCTDQLDEPLGKLELIPITPGQQFRIRIGGQETVFNFAASGSFQDDFEDAAGHQIMFDGEMHFSGLFGDKGGVCAP